MYGSFLAKPTDSQIMWRIVIGRPITFPVNLTGSVATCIQEPATDIQLPILQNGIQIGSSGQIYEIVSLVSTLAVISPALPFDVSSGDAVTQIGNSVEVKIGEGTLTYSEKRAITYVLNRGKIYTVKLGDDAPVDVSFQFIWEFLRAGSGEPPTVEEALRKIGAASAWVSSSPDTCEPYSVDIIICNLPPCEGQNEIITLPAFRHEDLAHDLKAGTVSVTGKCNVNFARVQHNS